MCPDFKDHNNEEMCIIKSVKEDYYTDAEKAENDKKNYENEKERGYNQGQGEKLTLERRMIYVFSALRKEMNNGPEKFSSSEAKKI